MHAEVLSEKNLENVHDDATSFRILKLTDSEPGFTVP